MTRKLASIQTVRALSAIEGADFIELAHIEGWQCVVKKGEFAVGEPACFLEIDAIPPDVPEFRFLWTPKDTPDGAVVARPPKYRIRTAKLRGQLSQGLLITLDTVREVARQMAGDDALDTIHFAHGDDVAGLLAVGKYEPPQPTGMGEWRAAFPGVVGKTDEIRVQSVPEVLEELRGLPYVATLKYDGTSATFLCNPLDDGAFHACSRNMSIREGDNLYWQVAHRYHLPERLAAHPRYVVQGEVVGPGIQKNPLGLPDKQLFVFDLYDLETLRYLLPHQARVLLAEWEIPAVAVVEEGEDFRHTQDSLLALAEGKYPGTKNEREGIVIRATDGRPSAVLGGRLSFKAISNRYLLKEE